MDLHVIPECYIDTKLIEALCPPRRFYNHQKGCFTVMNTMRSKKLADDFAVAIVDEDKKVVEYSKEFHEVANLNNQLKLLKHPAKNHFIIYICPAAETWMLTIAKQENIDIESFGLPKDLKRLTAITKTSKSENKDPYSSNLRDLFKALKRSDSDVVKTLTFWINHLKANPYNADLELLKSQ